MDRMQFRNPSFVLATILLVLLLGCISESFSDVPENVREKYTELKRTTLKKVELWACEKDGIRIYRIEKEPSTEYQYDENGTLVYSREPALMEWKIEGRKITGLGCSKIYAGNAGGVRISVD